MKTFYKILLTAICCFFITAQGIKAQEILKYLTHSEGMYISDYFSDNNNLYGITRSGGLFGQGSIFKFDLDSKTYQNLFNFTPEEMVVFSIKEDNHIYYLTYGNSCRINKLDLSDNTTTIIYEFPYDHYVSKFIKVGDIFYGIDQYYSYYWTYSIFKYNMTSDVYEVVYTFDWEYPQPYTLEFYNNKLYGIMSNGGLYYWGFIYELDLNYYNLKNLFDIGSGQRIYEMLIDQGKLYTGVTSWYGGDILLEINLENYSQNILKIFDSYSTNIYGLDNFIKNNELIIGSAYYGGNNNNGGLYTFNINTKEFKILNSSNSSALALNNCGIFGTSSYSYTSIWRIPFDQEKPSLNVTLSQYEITKANKKLVDITATVTPFDNCEFDWRLESIKYVDGNDIKYWYEVPYEIQGAEIGTQDTEFQLRAMRNSKGGRKYIITYAIKDEYGNETFTDAVVAVPFEKGKKVNNQVEEFELAVNVTPNPISSTAVIDYSIIDEAPTTINVYSLSGEKIMELKNVNYVPGVHSVEWDGRNADGTPLPSGSYILELVNGANRVNSIVQIVR